MSTPTCGPPRGWSRGSSSPASTSSAGTLVLAAASAMLFALAIYIFRRRELALYSGQ
jgi:hypothetical protein